MADLLIDTNVVSYIVKGVHERPRMERNLSNRIYSSVLRRSPSSINGPFGRNWGTPRIQHLQRELQHYTVIGFDDDLAWNWARITSIPGHPIEPGDAWIAAAALRHNIPLVTHNRRHFEHIPGLVVISEAP
jgi:tRNA(fMet)-specific endonuclease VapC